MTFYTYHTDPEEPPTDQCLVFATSLKGDLKLGFGPLARQRKIARLNRPMGYNIVTGRGSSFGIPVKNKENFDLRTLDILTNIDEFVRYSANSPFVTFHITDFTKVLPRIQKGVIIRLFTGCHRNCIFPESWISVIEPPTKLIEEKLELQTGIDLKPIWEKALDVRTKF